MAEPELVTCTQHVPVVVTSTTNALVFTEKVEVCPLVPVGTCVGSWMHKRVPERPFTLVMYVGAAAGAVWMLWSARH